MSGGILAWRLLRRFDEGELDALRANGEGVPGGPPTTSSKVPSGPGMTSVVVVKPLSLDERELRRSLGGGMGDGDDMTAQ